MVQVMEPQLVKTIFDRLAVRWLLGGGLRISEKTCSAKDWQILQKSIFGGEAKSLPYLLAQMNLLLHGFEYPDIDDKNSLRFPLAELGIKD